MSRPTRMWGTAATQEANPPSPAAGRTGEIQDVVGKKQVVHAPSRGRVRQVDIVAVAEEHRQPEESPAPVPAAKPLPREETKGTFHPIRALYSWIWSSGMLDTVTNVTPAV